MHGSHRCFFSLHRIAEAAFLWLFVAAVMGGQAVATEPPASTTEPPASTTIWVATKDGSLYRAAQVLHIEGVGTEVTTRRGVRFLVRSKNRARVWSDEDSQSLQPAQVLTTSCPGNRYVRPLFRELLFTGEQPFSALLTSLSPGISVRFLRSIEGKQEQRSWADVEIIQRPPDRLDACEPPEEQPRSSVQEDKGTAEGPATVAIPRRVLSGNEVHARIESDGPIKLFQLMPNDDKKQIAEGTIIAPLILHANSPYVVVGTGLSSHPFELDPGRFALIRVRRGSESTINGGVVLMAIGGATLMAGGLVPLLTGALMSSSSSGYGRNETQPTLIAGAVGAALGVSGLIAGIVLVLQNRNKVSIQ